MNKKLKKIIWIVSFIIISMLGLARLTNGDLDKQAELATEQMYKRDSNHIIDGAQSIVYKAGYDQALVFIHGFASNPRVFAELIHDIANRADSDIYAPLLPYDGRDLQTLSKTDNNIVLDYLDKVITEISGRYKKVTVVGLSYGGARLARLALDKKIPDNVTLVLYAPAIYLKSNGLWQRSLAKLYSGWRDYCDYAILGCAYPNYQSADETAKEQFAKEKTFHYISVRALLTMYNFDLANRNTLRDIQRPYSIIMAVDDNRVAYDKIKDICHKNNKYCTLYAFSSGKHLIHWGKNKETFEDLLLRINAS